MHTAHLTAYSLLLSSLELLDNYTAMLSLNFLAKDNEHHVMLLGCVNYISFTLSLRRSCSLSFETPKECCYHWRNHGNCLSKRNPPPPAAASVGKVQGGKR